jgi:hypothetical protein
MNRFLAAAVLSVLALPAHAVGTLIPASARMDAVHDDARGLVYISNGTQVLRWQESTGTFLSPIALGGQLTGMDLSPDQRTLVVADRSGSATQSWVYLVDLDTLAVRQAAVATPDTYEGGTFSVAYGADGRVYTTSTFNGSGWVPMRRYDPAGDTWTTLATVSQETMLSASGDAQTIAFAEANISSGYWGLIDVPTGGLWRSGWDGGAHQSLFEIATDRWGSQFAIPTYQGAYVYDDAYAKVASFGTYAATLPIGVAYHPVERIAYFPFAQTSQVRVYDMATLTQTGAYDFEHGFGWTGTNAYEQGRTRISRDGSLLMVTVGGGVRAYRQYAPLQADDVAASTPVGQPVAFALGGSIGNGGALAYELATPPAHGTVSIVDQSAQYTPAPGYSGTDAFTYRVRYGRAERTATASVTVVDANRAPVANDDTARARNTAILVPVLANDSDPDGDALALVAVSPASAGSASIQGNQVRFVPPKKWPSAPITFTYTVRDPGGKQDTATVSVTRY